VTRINVTIPVDARQWWASSRVSCGDAKQALSADLCGVLQGRTRPQSYSISGYFRFLFSPFPEHLTALSI
jgi:hypothetical protein